MPIRMLTVARTKPHVHVTVNGPEEEQHAAGEKQADLEARAKIEDLKAQAEVDNLEAQAKNDVLVLQQHELVNEHESQDERRAEQRVATEWSPPHDRKDERVKVVFPWVRNMQSSPPLSAPPASINYIYI